MFLNRMGSALPAIIGCPRAILSRNQTREIVLFFYFTAGDSVASCTVTIHLPRSKKPAPIDPLPIHHAAPLVSIPRSPLLPSCSIQNRSNEDFDFIFRQLSPRNSADIILGEDSCVDRLFHDWEGGISRDD